MLGEVDSFVNWLRRRNPQARTWRDYSYDLHRFVQVVGDKPPGEVSFHDIDRFVMEQAEHGMSPSTINRRLAAITALYTFLSDDDPSLICPVLPHRHAIKQRERLPRPIPASDVAAFLAVIDHSRDLAMFLLMLRCGLRISEVACIHMSDLYLDETHARVVAHGKGSKERSVYLSHRAEHALRAYLALRSQVTSDFVFLSYQGKGMSTTAIHKRLMRYRREVGVDLTAHRLRHTFASDLVEADVSVLVIQKLLGHAWLETTQNYVAASDHQVRADFYAASEKLEDWR